MLSQKFKFLWKFGVLTPACSGSMLSKNLIKGSSINASKPVEVLNRLTRSGAMFAWYQDKLVEVLNMPIGSWAISDK